MWFFALVIVLLIGAVAVVASGRWGSMAEVYDDRPEMVVPAGRPLTGDDIRASRFAIGVRGYRMDEVDTLLDRVAHEVAVRDRRISHLERAAQSSAPRPVEPDGSAPAHDAVTDSPDVPTDPPRPSAPDQPSGNRPDRAEPIEAEQEGSQPDRAESAEADPVRHEPDAESAGAEPAWAEPAWAEPAGAEPERDQRYPAEPAGRPSDTGQRDQVQSERAERDGAVWAGAAPDADQRVGVEADGDQPDPAGDGRTAERPA